MTELAKLALADGQIIRPFHNYFAETFDGLRQEIWPDKFNVDNPQFIFYDRIEFYKHLQDVLSYMVTSCEQWKADEPDEYNNANGKPHSSN